MSNIKVLNEVKIKDDLIKNDNNINNNINNNDDNNKLIIKTFDNKENINNIQVSE